MLVSIHYCCVNIRSCFKIKAPILQSEKPEEQRQNVVNLYLSPYIQMLNFTAIINSLVQNTGLVSTAKLSILCQQLYWG